MHAETKVQTCISSARSYIHRLRLCLLLCRTPTNLRILENYPPLSNRCCRGAHGRGLCGGVMQPVAGGGYVALRRRHGRQTRAYAPRSTVREVWVRPGHHSTLTTAYRMFMSSWCSWMSRAAPARFLEPSLQAHARGASVARRLRCTQWDPKRQPQAFFSHQAALNETEGDETAVCTQRSRFCPTSCARESDCARVKNGRDLRA